MHPKREANKKDKMDEIKNMVPECTYKFFSSEEGKNIVKKKQKMDMDSIKHY